MSSRIREEFRRFMKLLITYGQVVFGGMILSGMFLFLYAGIRANYVSIAVLATVLSTISLSVVMLLLYLRFHEKRLPTRFTKPNRTEHEEMKRMIAEAIADLPSTEKKKLSTQDLFVVEHVLLPVFQWGRLIGKMFYRGLAMVNSNLVSAKAPGKSDTLS